MVLDLGDRDEEENIFEHARDFDQGLGKVRKGAISVLVAQDGSGDVDKIADALKLVSGGGLIQIKEGVYDESSLTIPSDNIKIQGITPGTPRIQGPTSGVYNLFSATGKVNIVFEGIYLATDSTVGSTGINLNNCNRCIIKDCYATAMRAVTLTAGSYRIVVTNNTFDSGDDTIYLNGANYNIIEGNNIYNASAEGIWLDKNSTGNVINNNNLFNCYMSIWNQSGANNVMVGNTISNDDTTVYDSGILTNGIKDIIISNNILGEAAYPFGAINNQGINTQIGHNITE